MAFVDTKFEEPEVIEYAKLEKIGDSIEGVFAGTEERKNNFNKMEVHAKIKTGVNEAGEAIIMSLRTNQRLLAQVAPVRRGQIVRIEYVDDKPNEGMDRDGNPLKPTKLYRVQVDDGSSAAPARKQPRDDFGAPPSSSRGEDDIPF